MNKEQKQKQEKQKFVVQWHITSKCNLRCTHCYQDDYTKDLSLDNLISIFSKIKEFISNNSYKCHINFTGGEPFLSHNLWELLDLAEENNFTFGILTNGTVLNKYIAKKLTNYNNLSFIQISLDGSQVTHDTIRGKGTFKKALQAIKQLRKNKIKTMVSFTCHQDNLNELKKVIRICKRNKVDIFWTDRLIPTHNENEKLNTERLLTTNQFKEYVHLLAKEKVKAERNPFCKTEIRINRALQNLNGLGDCYECSAGKKLIAILADGKVLPCRRLPIELGSLINKNKNDSLESMIEDFNKKEVDKIPDDCKQCELKYNCKAGAKCLTYAVKNSFNNKDINCWK